MWPFSKRIQCAICRRKMTPLNLKDLARISGSAAESYPYRCSSCGQVFCFNCLNRQEGPRVGSGLYSVKLVCPRCSSLEIQYAFSKPLPESPDDLVRRKARELRTKHGRLVKVNCKAQDSIALMYQDGTVVDGRLGEQRPQLTCGYAGQGPSQFHSFLVASGFNVSMQEIYDKRPPYVLQQEG